jgi:hypothetical protein
MARGSRTGAASRGFGQSLASSILVAYALEIIGVWNRNGHFIYFMNIVEIGTFQQLQRHS